MRRHLRVSLCCCLLLAGCTSFREWFGNGFKVGPDYTPPPAPVAYNWIDANDSRVLTTPTDSSHWWTVFEDPTLNSLIERAYAQNLDVRSAGARVLQARAELGIARGAFFPQRQQASGSFSRNQISRSVAFVAPDAYFDLWTTGFNVAWEVDVWGRFRRSIASANANLDASQFDYDDVIRTLVADVATNYVLIRIFQERIAFARQSADLQERLYRKYFTKEKEGSIDVRIVKYIEANLERTRSLIPPLEAAARRANNQLCILLGIPPQDLLSILGESKIPTVPADVVVGIPADLVRRRPDIRRAERQLAAQSELIGVAEAELYPAFFISGTYNYQAKFFPKLFGPQSVTASVGPSFQWNILNYGRILNNVRLQDARFQELVANYQNTVLKAAREVEDAIIGFLKAQEEARDLENAVKAWQVVREKEAIRINEGKDDPTEILVVERFKVDDEQRYAVARGDIALNLIQTYRALGGGWQIRLAGDVAPVGGPIPWCEGEMPAEPSPHPTTAEIPLPPPQKVEKR